MCPLLPRIFLFTGVGIERKSKWSRWRTWSDVVADFAGVLKQFDEHAADEDPPVHVQNEEHDEERVLEVILDELFSPTQIQVLRHLNTAIATPSMNQGMSWSTGLMSYLFSCLEALIIYILGAMTDLMLQMIQKGKMTRRRINHESTKKPNRTLAPASKAEYLHSFALSNKTSLTSCTSKVLTPAL